MVSQIINAITGAFNGLLTGLGKTVVDFFDELVVVKSSSGEITGLTSIATWGLVFLGISLITTLMWRIFKRV